MDYHASEKQFYQLPNKFNKSLKENVLPQLGERSIVFESAYVQQAVRIPKLTISNGSTLGENSIQFVQK